MSQHVGASIWRIRKMTGANFVPRTIKRRPFSWRDGNSVGKNDVMTIRNDALRHVRKHLIIANSTLLRNALHKET